MYAPPLLLPLPRRCLEVLDVFLSCFWFRGGLGGARGDVLPSTQSAASAVTFRESGTRTHTPADVCLRLTAEAVRVWSARTRRQRGTMADGSGVATIFRLPSLEAFVDDVLLTVDRTTAARRPTAETGVQSHVDAHPGYTASSRASNSQHGFPAEVFAVIRSCFAGSLLYFALDLNNTVARCLGAPLPPSRRKTQGSGTPSHLPRSAGR